jgi:hypothetical protein
MAKLKDITDSVVTRAKAGQKAVTNAATAASKAVTSARASASSMALTASRKLAPPTQKGKGVKRALVAAGAVAGVAMVAAASAGAARARKR